MTPQPSMWTIERQLDFLNCAGTEEMQLRMHRDLQTLQVLDAVLADSGVRVIVENGYAVDAACSGRLTRMHYDGDILVATPGFRDDQELRKSMVDAATQGTELTWDIVQEDRPSWVTLYEADKRNWGDGVTGTDADEELAHRINVHIVHAPDPFAEEHAVTFEPKPNTIFTRPVTKAVIEDTLGSTFELTVATVSDSAATKTRWIRSFADLYGGIDLRESDFVDFETLFGHPDFDAGTFIGLLSDYYASQGTTPDKVSHTILNELEPVSHLVPESVYRCLGHLSSQ